jgi:hypothetical protein
MLFVFFVVKFLFSRRDAEAQREKIGEILAAKRHKKHKKRECGEGRRGICAL